MHKVMNTVSSSVVAMEQMHIIIILIINVIILSPVIQPVYIVVHDSLQGIMGKCNIKMVLCSTELITRQCGSF